MGVRGELFSNRIILPNRTYFFNVKENRMGDLYLNIVESKNRDNGGFERQSVILFADDLQEFLKGFDESLKVMEKAMRDKRQSGGSSRREKREEKPDRDRSQGDRNRGGERAERKHRGERGGERRNEREGNFKKYGGDRSRQKSGGRSRGGENKFKPQGREHSNERGFEHRSGKRVVVKKKD
ncbi:MAG: DUF3276 family protein [Treponema sp.]|nr:DUF3276 family protein [Treponema sp.]